MICKLCLERQADKKNTHFLTDGIIRSCLNLDGSKEREKGFYFDLSNKTPFVEFNFQRETTIDKLENSIGRQVSDEEIDKAKVIPFSVDNVFCSTCEARFTEIESKFIANILPQFRDTRLSDVKSVTISDNITVRLFFYLQIWRTSVCEETFSLSARVSENLRQIINNYGEIEISEIVQYPLSITYLETLGDEKEFTTNFVGFTSDQNPNVIFMNDIIIQFFESQNELRFIGLHGLNLENDFKDFINFEEKQFLFKILHNANRKQFLVDFITAEKVKQSIKFYVDSFSEIWLTMYGEPPSFQITQEYLKAIIGKKELHILNYTKEDIIEKTRQFILNNLNI
jgi:hypothetical protein